MPYEVFDVFYRCSDLHGSHRKFTDAVACFTESTKRYNGNIPVHPVSQKYVYAIAAIDKKGNQRNYSNSDKNQANTLSIDPKAQLTEIPTITTFTHVARMYHEALKLIPISGINLASMFDYKDKKRHFWTTDAGKGQALAYAQQSVFTLELSLKAYLEVLGKLASPDATDVQKWQTHELGDLCKLLSPDEMKQLEQWWQHSDAKRTHFNGTFQEFVRECKKLYDNWRYITDLKSSDISLDIRILLSASEFLIEAGHRQFRQHSPVKITTEVKTYPDEGITSSRPVHAWIEGRVRDIRIPTGFNPFDIVEIVIDSDAHEQVVTAQLSKHQVEKYYGLEGERVELTGLIEKGQPHILRGADHFDERRARRYATQRLTLKGAVYDIKTINPTSRRDFKINVVLNDHTFFSTVECFFVTDEERETLKEFNLGDSILISGLVTLLEGRPLILVDPCDIEIVDDEDENRLTSGVAH